MLQFILHLKISEHFQICSHTFEMDKVIVTTIKFCFMVFKRMFHNTSKLFYFFFKKKIADHVINLG